MKNRKTHKILRIKAKIDEGKPKFLPIPNMLAAELYLLVKSKKINPNRLGHTIWFETVEDAIKKLDILCQFLTDENVVINSTDKFIPGMTLEMKVEELK